MTLLQRRLLPVQSAIMTIIYGRDHTIFLFPAPWTTIILYTDLPLKTPINSQDRPAYLSVCLNITC